MAKVKKAKGKWAIWKTIVCAISAVILVAAATVGGVYLTGGFDEKHVNPESITFVLDENLYNPDNVQFEVTNDFQLTISTPTSDVTQKAVNLSFPSGVSVQHDFVAKTISDGIITVPEVVQINEAFTVKLNKKLTQMREEQIVEWVTGGISTLRASSAANDQIPSVEVKIAVDVAVHSIEVELFDAVGNPIDQITSGESFTAKTKFYPVGSNYFYSDDKNEAVEIKREKLEYFTVIGAGNIEFVYDDAGVTFRAGERLRDNNTSSIVGYTFKSADKQTEVLNNFSQYSGAELYSTVLSYLANNDEYGITNADDPTQIEVVEATIGYFRVEQAGFVFNLINNSPYRVTMNYDELADNYLGATIGGTTTGSVLKSLLKNVAIAFEQEVGVETWRPVTSDQLQVSGRGSVVIDGVTYYLPNTQVSDLDSAYFDLTAKQTMNMRMTVVLLEAVSFDNDGEPIYAVYEPDKYSFRILVNSQERQEGEISWSKEDPINITLGYNGSEIDPKTYIFGQGDNAVGVVPSTNVYQTKVYFAYFGTNEQEAATAIANTVLGESGYSRAGLYNLGGTQPYYLFPLEGDELTVRATQNFQVYVATVRTSKVGTQEFFEYDDNGLYYIEKAAPQSLTVYVAKSLYQGSVAEALETTVEGYNNQVMTENYYIYAGSDNVTKIKIRFEINADSAEVFSEKLVNDILLSLHNNDGVDITNYFSVEYPNRLVEFNDGTGARYFADFTLAVRSTINISGDVQLKSAKMTETGSGLTWEREVVVTEDGAANKFIYVYMPQVQDITISSDAIDLTRTINVSQELNSTTGDFNTNIIYFTKTDTDRATGTFASATELVASLSVVVTDDHMNTAVFNDSWSYATTNSTVITVGGKRFTFRTADNATAEVYAVCGQKNTARIRFQVTSKGILAVEYDNQKIIDGAEDWQRSASEASVAVSKYANESGRIGLNNLVKLYTGLDENEQIDYNTQFDKFVVKFDEVRLTQLQDELVALFGTNPMLTLYANEYNQTGALIGTRPITFTDPSSANSIHTALSGKEIASIVINKEFARDRDLYFVISDASGAVSINLTLNLLANASTTNTQANVEVYASVGAETAGNIIYNNNPERRVTIQSILSEKFKGYKIATNGNQTNKNINGVNVAISECEIVDGATINNVVGEIDANGRIVFNDFWDTETKYYRLVADLEGFKNSYALSITTEYAVNRNIKIVYKSYTQDDIDAGTVSADKLGQEKTLKVLGTTNAIREFVGIVRAEGDAAFNFTNEYGEPVAPTIEAVSDNPVLTLIGSNYNASLSSWEGSIATTSANAPIFDYHNDSQAEQFVVKVGSYTIDTIDLKYELGIEPEKVAVNLYQINNETKETTSTAKTETLNGKTYIVAQRGTYKINGKISTDPTGQSYVYDFDIYQSINIDGRPHSNTFYNLMPDSEAGKFVVSFNTPQLSAIQGLTEADEKDIILVFSTNGARQAVAIMPLLVSNIGLDYVNYVEKQEVEADTARAAVINAHKEYNTLENALSEPSKLYEKGIYQEVKAGEKITIASKNILGQTPSFDNIGFVMLDDEGAPRYTPSIVPTMPVAADQIPSGQDRIYYPELIKTFKYLENGNIELQLNHLSTSIQTAFVAVRVVVSNGSWELPMYYLLKVTPNTIVNEPCYAFDSETQKAGKENLTGPVNEIIGGDAGINLNTPWGDATLNNGKTRFSVTIDGKRITDLASVDRVVSVSIGAGDPFTTEEQYKDIISVQLTNGVMRVTPKTTAAIRLVIKRVYNGGTGDDELSVVGGEIEYVFDINASADYYLSYADNSTDKNEDGKNNSSVEVNALNRNDAVWTLKSTATNERTLSVKLINNTVTMGEVGTEVPGKLSFAFFKVNDNGQMEQIETDAEGIIDAISYDNVSFDLKATRAAYVSSDKKLVVLFYTEYGLLGQLTIVVEASAQAEYKELANNVYSGEYNLSDFVDIKVEDELRTDYKVTKAEQLFEEGDSAAQKLFVFDAEAEKPLKFYPAIRDEKVRIQIEIEFVDEAAEEGAAKKTYSFVLELEVKKAIVQKGNTSAAVGTTEQSAERISADKDAPKVYAQDIVALAPHDLMRFAHANKETSATTAPANFDGHILFTWTGLSGRDYIKPSTDVLSRNINIQTNNVGVDDTSVNVLITAYLFKGSVSGAEYNSSILTNEAYGHYATFMVQYSFAIQPNVKIITTYPNPTKTAALAEKLQAEYLKNGAVFARASDLIGSPAVFSTEKRIAFVQQGTNENVTVDKYSVKVEQLNNVTMFYNNANDPKGAYDITTEGGHSTLFDNTEANNINLPDIWFRLGTRDSKGDIIDNGTEGIVTLRIECNGVTEYYNIRIQDSILTINVNKTNEDENGAETIYVDSLTKTNAANILDSSRMIHFRLNTTSENNSIANIISSPYVLVFENKAEVQGSDDKFGTTGRVFYELRTLTSNDIGKTLNFDYGTKLAGYEYVGTYVNDIRNFRYDDKNNILGFALDELGGLSAQVAVTEDRLLYSLKPQLVSRIELSYIAGENYIPVDYSLIDNGRFSYASNIKGSNDPYYTLSGYIIETNVESMGQDIILGRRYIDNNPAMGETGHFKLNLANGQSDATRVEQFSTTYTYRTDIDIDVRDSGLGALQTITVGQPNIKLIEQNHVYHPSTGVLLSSRELAGQNAPVINLQIVNIDFLDWRDTVDSNGLKVTDFTSSRDFGGNALLTPYGSGNAVYRFLSVSPYQPENENVLDFNISGMGAKNKDTYVLLYFTYSVTIGADTYVKDYFLIYKVEPDYVINFAGTQQNDVDDLGRQSNESNPYIVAPAANSNDTYSNITIAGSKDNAVTNIVTVRHSGENAADVAADFFTYTLTPTSDLNGQYNILENINQKMSTALNANGWSGVGADNRIWRTGIGNTVCVLAGVRTVYIGQQYYRFYAKDVYGYEFSVYITLDSGRVAPAVSETQFNIQENAEFDIGAQFEILNDVIVNSNTVDIQPTVQNNSSTSEYRMLNITNLNAWGYDTTWPTNLVWHTASWHTGEEASAYPTAPHYCFKGDLKAADARSDSKYLEMPDFTKVTVQEINFKDSDGNLLQDARIDATKPKEEGSSERVGTSLATNKDLKYGETTVNGERVSVVSYRSPDKGVYKMNKLPGYVYGASATASVTTVITLLFNGENGNREYFDVSVPTVVTRDVSFVPNTNNVVRDGDPFLINDYMTVYAASSLGSLTPTFYDDTISFTLPARAAITFSLTRERAGVKTSSNIITIQNTAEYPMTEYRSISAIMGDTSQAEDKLTLNVVSHSNSALGIQDDAGEEMYRGFYMKYGSNWLYMANEVDETTEDYRLVGANAGDIKISTSTSQIRDENLEEVKFTYVLASTGLSTFEEGKDKINIVSSRRIRAYRDGIDISKYYIATLDNVAYQVAQAYRVTSYYQDMSQNSGAEVMAVRKYMTLKSADGGETDTVLVPRLGWTEGMTLNIGRYSYTGLSTIPYDSFNNNANGKLYYRISSEDGSSGAATIDNNGLVTTTSNFSISAQHFVVNIYIKASGLDGTFSRESEYDKLLGSVTFMLEPPQGVSEDSLGTVNGVPNQKIINAVDGTHNKITTKNIVMQAGEYKVEDEDIVLDSAYNGREVVSTVSQVVLPNGMEIAYGSTTGQFIVGGINVGIETRRTQESFVLIKGQPLYSQANDENVEYILNGRDIYQLNPDWTEGGSTTNKYINSGNKFTVEDRQVIVTGASINADGYIEYKSGEDTYYFRLSSEEVKVKYTQINGRILNEDTAVDEQAVNADGYVRFTDWTNGERYYCKFVKKETGVADSDVTARTKLIVNTDTEILSTTAASSVAYSTETLNGYTFYVRLRALYSAVGSFGYKVSGV